MAGAPDTLLSLSAGMPVLYGGDKVAYVSSDLADAFAAGDRLVVVQSSGALLHIAAQEQAIADEAVTGASDAFAQLARCSDDQISAFYDAFAQHLEDQESCAPILVANATDVAVAQAAGRSTTRLELTPAMRADMVAGLRGWRDSAAIRDSVLETVEHEGWRIEQRRAPLGVVAFVFEGRPNVFADAAGVLRSGNTVVFRIGRDALGTAQAIVEHALRPALLHAGLPVGAVQLLATPARSGGWALFSDPRVALAVARGSGQAVEQLGAVARQAGIPVSLHGTGGGWMVAGAHADADRFSHTVRHSLDRKVCNTLNVCCIVRSRSAELVPLFLDALVAAAATRSAEPKLHVHQSARSSVPHEWFERTVTIGRAEGCVETQAQLIGEDDLGVEWEWEASPEVTLLLVDSVDDAIALCNAHSPRLVASLISDDLVEQQRFYDGIDAPFVGDGFTRWVDGQFALLRPELGLSNWENGRLFGRSGVLSGDSVFTVRTRMYQTDDGLHR